ncbi:MAG TPA: antitoxin [Candidatus Limnocylindria bacterium]|nr:antitoxin [Candidatus Limnocylindria bacterium]
MPRTTLDLDATVLQELKKRQRREGKSLGRIASELLAGALRREERVALPDLAWTSRPMRARVDLEDKEQLRRALEQD